MAADERAETARANCEHLGEGTCNACVAAAIREAEAAMKERCAKACESLPFRDSQMDDGRSGDLAAAIRRLD